MSKSFLAEFHRDRFSTVQACNHILIAHLDGAVVPLPRPHSLERRVTRLLVERELLELGMGGTVITALGRCALSEILACYADLLLAARTAETELWRRAPRKARKLAISGPHITEIPQENKTPFLTETS